ncbi:MAG: NADH-quinone oxidoreductase subunit L, partial [Aquificae bacterium]|nr:NADH-quinone oxidoreductase subunit L [Aquificota bacterium]
GVMAVVAGFFEGWYMHAVGGEHKEIHLNIAVMSVGVAILGIVLAYGVFIKRFLDPEKTYESLKALHTTFKEQFFTEKLYHGILAAGYMSYSKVLYAVGERQFIDGIVNGLAFIVQSVGQGLKFLQNGKLNWYALGLGTGFAILVLLLVALIYGGGY